MGDKMKVKARTLPGFMELMPDKQILFNKMYDSIRKSYEKFGFVPLDTPILEASEVLLAKAGGETEKQIYRFTKGNTDMSMRFDLTVPLAKYVAINYGQLTFPFRRYQLSKVFRGERPQKGRYREFYQCDIDIIGDGELSILNDAEIPSVIYTTFKDLGFDKFVIHINNRKLLNGFFEYLGLKENISDILRIVDKLEKIGEEAVKECLAELEIEENKIDEIIKFIKIDGAPLDILNKLNSLGIDNEEFNQGLDELSKVVQGVKAFGIPEDNFKIDLKIARGLDYYTGTVYETMLTDFPGLGSVCSGGRYDNLAEYYTNKKLPGVGISIGLSRLYDYLLSENVIKPEESSTAKAIVIPMTEDINYAFNVAQKLRESDINTEVCYNRKTVKSMLNYANKLKIPYAVFIGEDEIKNNVVTVKDMNEGNQQTVNIEEAINIIK